MHHIAPAMSLVSVLFHLVPSLTYFFVPCKTCICFKHAMHTIEKFSFGIQMWHNTPKLVSFYSLPIVYRVILACPCIHLFPMDSNFYIRGYVKKLARENWILLFSYLGTKYPFRIINHVSFLKKVKKLSEKLKGHLPVRVTLSKWNTKDHVR